MGIIIYSFSFNISNKMSYGVLECDIVMLQNYILMIFVIKRSVTFAWPYMYVYVCVYICIICTIYTICVCVYIYI